jgi:hypothetical protein
MGRKAAAATGTCGLGLAFGSDGERRGRGHLGTTARGRGGRKEVDTVAASAVVPQGLPRHPAGVGIGGMAHFG